MWKESYRIGVEAIDKQHMALFQMVDGLLKDMKNGVDKEKLKKAVDFLKKYVVVHFRDEEAYQQSIHYSGFEKHKILHRDFTNAVLDFERKLVETGYSLSVLKELAGTLTAWLIYHVADADQQIVAGETKYTDEHLKSYARSFTLSISEVLSKMAGLDRSKMTGDNIPEIGTDDSVFVEIGLIGDKKGEAVFGFSKELALNLVKNMTFMDVDQIDELVCSALAEISNISSGNAATYITRNGLECDIKTPVIHVGKSDLFQNLGGIRIQSDIGTLDVAVRING